MTRVRRTCLCLHGLVSPVERARRKARLSAQRSPSTGILRRHENFACIRIFYWRSRRKPSDIDITLIWREWTRNQAWFTGHRSSIQKFSLWLSRARGCLRPPHIALPRRRRGWAARSRATMSIARRTLIMLMTAPTPAVRPRLLLRVRDCTADRSKKIPERPCVCNISRVDQRRHRQPDHDSAEPSFHQDYFVSTPCHARLVINGTTLKIQRAATPGLFRSGKEEMAPLD
jgi:hypothetical protein